jgi:hypothetical protein
MKNLKAKDISHRQIFAYEMKFAVLEKYISWLNRQLPLIKKYNQVF